MKQVCRAAAIFTLHALIVCLPAAAGGLDDTVTASWMGIGLREWADRASAATGVPVVVDRRLDPETSLRLDCHDEPWRTVLRRVAEVVGGEVAELDESARIVPPGTAASLAWAEVSRQRAIMNLPPRHRALIATRKAWAWPAGSRPSELVGATATEAGVVVDGVDAVPHDHLPAASLPPLSLAERLDLVLAHYDLRVDWGRGPHAAGVFSGRIVPLETPPPSMPPERRRAGELARRTDTRKPPPAAPPAGGETFSLRLAAPLDEALSALAKRWQLALDLDGASLRRRGIAPGEIVRASVVDATREQVLDALLEPLGLEWTIAAGTLRVRAPDNRLD